MREKRAARLLRRASYDQLAARLRFARADRFRFRPPHADQNPLPSGAEQHGGARKRRATLLQAEPPQPSSVRSGRRMQRL